jgi:Rrf2 family protein
MISQTAEYALRAVLYLGNHEGMALTTHQIAKATRLPAGYLSKVLQSLGKAGIVHSQRGLHGGFTLTRDMKELTLLDVVNAVDPLHQVNCCPLGIPSHQKKLCPLHQRLAEVVDNTEKIFSEVSFAEILKEEGERSDPCHIPVPPRSAANR